MCNINNNCNYAKSKHKRLYQKKLCIFTGPDVTKLLLTAQSTELFGTISLLYAAVVPIGKLIKKETKQKTVEYKSSKTEASNVTFGSYRQF